MMNFVAAKAHYWTFFNMMMFGTAEQGFGGTFQHQSEKCPVVCCKSKTVRSSTTHKMKKV